MNKNTLKEAQNLHKNVPPDWYFQSIRRNPLQRFWHERRFKKVGQLSDKLEGKILDIGSADGVFSRYILKKTQAKKLIGIDVLKTSVDWANKHWRTKKISFKQADAHNLPFKDNEFEAVYALEVLEHTAEPKKVFLEVKRVLRPGGYGMFLVPTDSFLFRLIWWFVTEFWWAKIWNDCHIQSFNKGNSLASALTKHGFEIEADQKFLLGMLNVVKARKPKK